MKQRNTIISAIFILLMLSAGSVMGQFWSSNANGIHYNSGNVGIGTSLPIRSIDILETEEEATLRMTGPLLGTGKIANLELTSNAVGDKILMFIKQKNGANFCGVSGYSTTHSDWLPFFTVNLQTKNFEM